MTTSDGVAWAIVAENASDRSSVSDMATRERNFVGPHQWVSMLRPFPPARLCRQVMGRERRGYVGGAGRVGGKDRTARQPSREPVGRRRDGYSFSLLLGHRGISLDARKSARFGGSHGVT